jgi:DNA recombination protein RmuC
MEFTLLIIIAAASAVSILLSVITLITVLSRRSPANDQRDALRRIEDIRRDMLDDSRQSRTENLQTVQSSFKSLSEMLAQGQGRTSAAQDKRLAELNTQLTLRQDTLQSTVSDMMKRTDTRLENSTERTEAKLEAIRATVESRLTTMQEENGKKLDEMRATVSEKLEKTLEERIGQSFRLVSDRLEQVYKGLGEMQTLASGVGDLKKVLSNVKTRGVLGEVQLGAILEEILSAEQYKANVATKGGSSCVVEYAVKLPGDDDGCVWLPIDAKFPADAYTQLMEAYDKGDTAEIETAGTALDRRVRLFAKEIRDKYIDTPFTTDFAVMFLPFEGLYAEVARRGLFEALQRDYKITVAGPTTMAAFLNSLQMGFRTLAIQKRSGEVWGVLGAVKTEFEKFGVVLTTAQQKLTQANNELDKLVGVRTRQIQRRLSSVASMPEENSLRILDEVTPGGDEEEPEKTV